MPSGTLPGPRRNQLKSSVYSRFPRHRARQEWRRQHSELKMAKPLVFAFAGQQFESAFGRIDRTKLYGFKETEVLDENGQKCELATLAEDGRTVVGKGGTAMAYLDVEGNWCERGLLRPVNLEGDEITPVASSFSAPIELEREIDSREYLNHNIRAIYELDSEVVPPGLLEKLKSGAIYQFEFSYRGGLEADAGFLLMNLDHDLFMAVGSATTVQFIGLNHVTPTEESDASPDSDSLMDFDMI